MAMGTRCAMPKDVQHICWISRIKNIRALNKSLIKQPTQASQPDFESAFCTLDPSPLPVPAPVFAQLCGSSRWPCLVNSLTLRSIAVVAGVSRENLYTCFAWREEMDYLKTMVNH